MPFRCPLCAADTFEPVTVRRPDGSLYRSALLACGGCSVVFSDARRFGSRGPPEAPIAPASGPAPAWESRRTAGRRVRGDGGG